MRNQILRLLRCHDKGFLSGEELSGRLSVSRTTVWKQIQSLKSDGYEIEAHPRLGYALRGVPDRMLANEIKEKLQTTVFGNNIHTFSEIGSTNNEAKSRAAKGEPEGTVVIAESQSTGRGRLSRGWFSPPGRGIWFSLILRPPFLPYLAPQCTLMAAVAVTRALRQMTNLPCGIKWPNDILLDGKKLVGILTEMSAEMDQINYVVIGIGINVNIRADEFPPELQSIASSLQIATGHPVARTDLLCSILQEMEQLYNHSVQEGFGAVLATWRELSLTLGQVVDVYTPEEHYSGIAIDIDNEGALLVDTEQGRQRVIAGDVSIRSRGHSSTREDIHGCS